MKTTAAIIGVVVFIALGVYVYNSQQTPTNVETPVSGKVRGIEDVSSVKSTDISWIFEYQESDASTKVSVKIQENIYTAGTYQGSCSVRTDLNANELGGSLCWYAGFGDELGIYKENDRLIIKHREIEEGSDEIDGFKGEFESLLTL